MAFDLTPLALQNATVLRALAAPAEANASVAALAECVGRDADNLRKTLKVLQREGLVDQAKPLPALTEDGRAQLAAMDRAASPDAGGILAVRHGDLDPHPLNPRKDFETAQAEEGLNELRESILLRQLMQPIVVRPQPQPGRWWIVDGERRWRAIGQAIVDGDWPDDRLIPIVPRTVDDREHLLLSLTANLQRADMTAIEEAVAFNASVHDFGLSTEDLANELGKSQRYVQQRIALLKLSPDDQDRMRLPKDHPDYLSFKAARTLSQTPRAPAGPTFSQQMAAEREAFAQELAEDLGGEPGAPTAAPPPDDPAQNPDHIDFDSQVNDREALLLVEIADKADTQPDDLLGSEHYTRAQPDAMRGLAQGLVTKNLIGFRFRGDACLVRPRLFSTGLRQWLDGLGFYGDHRADVLFEMRARVHGADVARTLADQRAYATAWLNPAAPLPTHSDGSTPLASGSGAAHAREVVEQGIEKTWNTDQLTHARAQGWSPEVAQSQPEQPDLIEETAEERQARERRQAEAEAQAASLSVAEGHARRIGEWMAFARFRRAEGIAEDATDYLTTGDAPSPEDLAVALYRALAVGAVTEAGVILAVLQKRGDHIARPTLQQMPIPLIAEAVEAARAPEPEAGEA